MFALIYIPVKAFNIIYRTHNLDSEVFKKRYKTIIAGLKTHGPLWYQFIWVFYFRRAVYASIFVLFQSKPSVQIISANLLTLAMLIYLISIRPYDSFLSTMLSIVNDSLLVIMIAGCLRFLEEVITPSFSNLLGNTFVFIVIGTIVINWVSIIIYGITKAFKKKIRKKKIKMLKEKIQDSKTSEIVKFYKRKNKINEYDSVRVNSTSNS